ncbi:MAG TPA: DUF4383 domain-containing protein [Terriglobales bacterium]|jgi:hypothetical protein
MAARAYCILVGLLLLAVGILGLAGKVPLHLHHNAFHLISGIVALGVGVATPHHSRAFARIFGAIYVLLLVLGLAGVADLGPLRLSLNATPVLYVHGAVGLAGLLAGFLGRAKSEARPMKAAA